MRLQKLAMLLALGPVLTACSSWERPGSNVSSNSSSSPSVSKEASTAPKVDLETLSKYTSGWPEASQKAARMMIEKYGEPSESTDRMLVWRDQAPFKRITVTKEETEHKFPILHKDVIEHVIDYRPKTDKVDDVVKFDGSIYIDRTRGEMSARCDQEAMNLLALNLAHEVFTGKREVEDARTEFGRQALAFMNGEKGSYTEGLQFGRQMNTADADESISSQINFRQAQEAAPEDEATMNREEQLDQIEREEMTE
jgi:hypothetical protein